ncbi:MULTISPECIES: hypothetical protein [unclassified Neisseria]|uniref:hypothetical protein n=1 Tax=unclassified Neisseria TaxID=2623750 RepID=UPI002666A001|nr:MULTISPECIES: hypothetical protein [unclassified Neisseria]MDO1510448.1 hypothetical protein [Neisseria sp. MVDL19-042950]MDO1516617.1 hypothetical protein [Neisseria sp. MVDL18-041461]MDO1563763.1 hypothetical protein [Neisseria sp. MVDL20-010259]
MKKFVLMILLFASTSSFAVDPFEVERVERSCKHEKSSILRDRYGTPSCDHLGRLYELEREQQHIRYAREFNESQERIAATPQRIIVEHRIARQNGVGSGYRWNGNEGRYCNHDAAGYPTNCY